MVPWAVVGLTRKRSAFDEDGVVGLRGASAPASVGEATAAAATAAPPATAAADATAAAVEGGRGGNGRSSEAMLLLGEASTGARGLPAPSLAASKPSGSSTPSTPDKSASSSRPKDCLDAGFFLLFPELITDETAGDLNGVLGPGSFVPPTGDSPLRCAAVGGGGVELMLFGVESRLMIRRPLDRLSCSSVSS